MPVFSYALLRSSERVSPAYLIKGAPRERARRRGAPGPALAASDPPRAVTTTRVSRPVGDRALRSRSRVTHSPRCTYPESTHVANVLSCCQSLPYAAEQCRACGARALASPSVSALGPAPGVMGRHSVTLRRLGGATAGSARNHFAWPPATPLWTGERTCSVPSLKMSPRAAGPRGGLRLDCPVGRACAHCLGEKALSCCAAVKFF